MDVQTKPQESLAAGVLPGPLLQAIKHIFTVGLAGVGLVGGTGLAGFYAGHRRSDDLDLFTANAHAQAATIHSVQALTTLGAVISEQLTTPNYSHSLVAWRGHRFTVDVVLDANVHNVGTFIATDSGIAVASLSTLLMMKAATLVSRCGEKDLFDLVWLTANLGMPTPAQWLELGLNIDQGMTAEAVLIALAGAELKEAACGFAVEQGLTPKEVVAMIGAFKLALAEQFLIFLEQQAPRPDLLKLFRFLKRK